MLHVSMGRFQLELFIFIAYFSTVVPLTICFLSCRPFVVNVTFSRPVNDERPTGNKTQLMSVTEK